MLLQLCLISYFQFSGAYFSKPKLTEKWKWRLTGIHLLIPQLELPQLRKEMRYKDLELNWSK